MQAPFTRLSLRWVPELPPLSSCSTSSTSPSSLSPQVWQTCLLPWKYIRVTAMREPFESTVLDCLYDLVRLSLTLAVKCDPELVIWLMLLVVAVYGASLGPTV